MNKKLPIGIQDYRKLRIGNYLTVDKTMMIQEFLEKGSEVTLITRPRRFGKTLNMSMLAEFFDVTKASKALFEGLAIMNTEYAKEMNQYPVVFVSFANAKGNLQSVVEVIKQEIAKEYKRYKFALKEIDDFDKPFYETILHSLQNPTDGNLSGLASALSFLMQKLEEYYDKKVYIFIDEYDTPFIQAHTNGFYDEIHHNLSNLFGTTLKGNQSLALAMLTGIQRIAKENIFSGLNNLEVCTVKDQDYAQYFGFTPNETKTLLESCELQLDDSVKQMYDGYQFGDQEIYNPWSIINYARRKVLEPYWVNTSSNMMIKNAMGSADSTFLEGYEILIETGKITTSMDMTTSFYEQANTASLWGLFVNAGYLTIAKKERSLSTLRIPNTEVLEEFKNLTLNHIKVNSSTFTELIDAFYTKNKDIFIRNYKDFLMQLMSYHDTVNENSYHSFLLGLCACLMNDFEVISNREEGLGRCDIILKAKKSNLPSYVIELKYAKKETFEKNPECLEVIANEAIEQIAKKQYDYEVNGEIIHVALAHYGKQVAMKWIAKAI